jgi:PAS domain S-box-containing protein
MKAPPPTSADHYLKQELYQRFRTDTGIFDFLQAGALDGIWYWDIENPQQEWLSPRLKELFGYRDDEVPNTSVWWQENIFPEDLAPTLDAFHRHCADPNYPYDQIVRYRHKNGSTVWVRCRGLAIRDEAGKPIRMLGAHTDVTAIKRAEERLRALYEAASDLYFAADLESGIILECNQAFLEATGVTTVVGTTFVDLCEEPFREAAQRVLRNLRTDSEIREIELSLRQKNQMPLRILLTANSEPDAQTGRQIFRAWCREIRHLKRFANFEVLTSALPGALLVLDAKGTILSANQAAAQMFGWRREELNGKALEQLLMASADGGTHGVPANADFVAMRQDGSVFPAQMESSALELDEGHFTTVGITDVSRRIFAESALRDSEHRYRQLIDGLPQLIWTATPDGKCDYLSTQWVSYTGIPEKVQLDSGWLEQVHPADREGLVKAWSNAMVTEAPFQFDFRIRRFDGTFHWFDTRAIPLKSVDGKIVKWFGTNTDVHTSRETGAALRREQQKLANLMAVAPAVFCSFCLRPDGSAYFPYADPKIVDLYGVTPDVLKRDAEHLFALFHPDDRQSVADSIRRSAESMQPWQDQFRMRHPQKGERWIEGHSAPAISEDGSVIWHGFLTDITERKQIEADRDFLLRLGACLQTASGPEAITTVGAQMLVEHLKLLRCSLSAINMARREATLLHKNVEGVVQPTGETLPLSHWMDEEMMSRLEAGQCIAICNTATDSVSVRLYETVYRAMGVGAMLVIPLRREGKWVSSIALSCSETHTWTERELNVARSAADQIWSAFEAARALAAERATNESLAASEERLRLALEVGAVGIWERNLVTGQIHWDQGARAIFEFTPDFPVTLEAILARLHPDDFDNLRKTMKAMADPVGEGHFQMLYRILVGRGNGVRYVFAQGQTYFEGSGNERRALRAVGTLQDITERKVSEAKLERSLFEKQTLLQEVHHRVKNNLQIISSLLSMQASLIEDKAALAKLVDSERRVRSMAMIHEHLYHQKDMSSIDLAEYLREMTGELSTSVGNAEIGFRLEVSPVAIPIDQAIPCGLLLNELLTNALKYAYPSGTGEVLIKLSSEDQSIAITVADSGVGLPANFDCNATQSLGMTIIQALTEQLDGELAISSSGGASFTIRFPKVSAGRKPDEGPPERQKLNEGHVITA